MYILNKIIEKCEYHSAKDWKPGETGNRTITIQQKDYTRCGKTELINEVRDLENQKLIQVKWILRYSDIEKIQYSLEQLPQLYQLAEQEAQKNGDTFVPKYRLVQQYKNKIEAEQKQGLPLRFCSCEGGADRLSKSLRFRALLQDFLFRQAWREENLRG